MSRILIRRVVMLALGFVLAGTLAAGPASAGHNNPNGGNNCLGHKASALAHVSGGVGPQASTLAKSGPGNMSTFIHSQQPCT